MKKSNDPRLNGLNDRMNCRDWGGKIRGSFVEKIDLLRVGRKKSLRTYRRLFYCGKLYGRSMPPLLLTKEGKRCARSYDQQSADAKPWY